MLHIDILQQKISSEDYRHLIIGSSKDSSKNESNLLHGTLNKFEPDVIQEQALVQVAIQQVRFDSNASHIDSGDEDITGTCPHCINPPMPPLRDYLAWREMRG